MKFIRRLEMRGLLSFPPDMPAFELQDLNVLIGPNGSGKSNVIEARSGSKRTHLTCPGPDGRRNRLISKG